MEGLLGTETMDEIMHTFFHRWKFKHPCRNDFIDVVNEVVPKNHGTRISNNKLSKEHTGIFEEKGRRPERRINTENVGGDIYESRVVVARLGDIQVPQEVLVRFEDGTEILEKWDGKERTHGFVYKGNSKVAAAYIDPNEKIYLDNNFLNNSLRTQADTTTIWKYMTQLMLRLQNVLQGVSFLV